MNWRRWLVPVQQVHVEALASPEVFHRLMDYLKNKENILCLMIGPDEPWCEDRITVNINKEKYISSLKENYRYLSKIAPMGLHTHLYHKYSIDRMSYEMQYDKISGGKMFLEELGIEVEDFAPGWWNFNEDTLKICENLGFQRFHYHLRPVPLKSVDMKFFKVSRWIHDFDL